MQSPFPADLRRSKATQTCADHNQVISSACICGAINLRQFHLTNKIDVYWPSVSGTSQIRASFQSSQRRLQTRSIDFLKHLERFNRRHEFRIVGVAESLSRRRDDGAIGPGSPNLSSLTKFRDSARTRESVLAVKVLQERLILESAGTAT